MCSGFWSIVSQFQEPSVGFTSGTLEQVGYLLPLTLEQ